MSVTDVTNTVQEARNGVKVAYTFDFKVFQASDLEVFEIDQTTLVATLATITTDYAVSINPITEGGTVTYVSVSASGKDSFIKRKLALTQATNVNTEGSIPANSLNNEYDRSRMIDIQQQEEIDRSIKFAETSSLTDVVFPESTSASARALKIPAWDTAGTALELITVSSVVNTDPIAVQGDIVQGSSLGVAEKLAIGTSGQSSEVVAGKLAYVTQKTITDFTNAVHNHSNTAGGGDLTDVQATSITLTGSTETDVDTLTKGNIVKAWASFAGATGATSESYNVSGIVRNSTGNYTISWGTDFANANYVITCIGTSVVCVHISKVAGSSVVETRSDLTTVNDNTFNGVIAIGEQS